MRYWVVMPAAGAGRRFGGSLPKQHGSLASSTVVEVALRPFISDERCSGVALALDAGSLQDSSLRSRLPAKVMTVAGGLQRSDSVLNGIEALSATASASDWVLVHDGARPCLSARDLDSLLLAGVGQPHGALLAAPVADTLKLSDAGRHCERTVERERLWRALTPQMFRLSALQSALRAARESGRTPTDEAQAMEWQGAAALLVEAQDANIKITTREDLAIAEAILAERNRGGPPCV